MKKLTLILILFFSYSLPLLYSLFRQPILIDRYIIFVLIPIFILIAVLILILPGFLSTNYKLKEFLRNLSIWAIITLVIIVIIYFISL